MKNANNNVFNLPNPEKWFCRLTTYTISHSQAQFELYYPDTKFIQYLNWSGLEYFSGPIRWQGANFRIGEQEECLQLLRISDQHANTKTDTLGELYRLYIADIYHSGTSSGVVKVVAGINSGVSLEDLFKGYK